MNSKMSPAKLTVGSKVQVLDDCYGFTKGQVVELYRLEDNGVHLFKGANTHLKHCDGQEGAYLNDGQYTVLPVASAHPHADLMLKYAQIAQYDDKPWENFECRTGLGEGWWPVVIEGFYGCYEYRLKPQEPVIQLGQIWVSLSNGQEVQVFRKPYPSEGGCGVVEKWVIGVVLDVSINLATSVVISELDLTKHFKRKV